MSFTTEDKIAKLRKSGWEIIEYPDAENNLRVNAKFYEPIGRVGKKKSAPLYNLFFQNKNDLVREIYYSSVGLQRDLAKEFGLTPEEVSYIKCGKSYKRIDKQTGAEIKVALDVGKRIKWIEDVRFFLTQIDERPYTLQLRRENMDHEDWRARINTMCALLTKRTNTHYYIEYENDDKNQPFCTVYAGDSFPIYTNKLHYPEIFSYLNSLFGLTHQTKAEDQMEIIRTIINH